MSKKEQKKVDLEALDRITKRVLAYRPSKHRKKKQPEQEKKKPPPK